MTSDQRDIRRTIRLAPGIRQNISKSRVSTSVGPRGASVTIGKRGIYANTGLPGTGMSYRTRLDKKATGTADTVSRVPREKKAATQTSANADDVEAAAEDNLGRVEAPGESAFRTQSK